MMSLIKWDNNFFEHSGLCIWIYNKGLIETTNEKYFKEILSKMYEKRKDKTLKINEGNHKNKS